MKTYVIRAISTGVVAIELCEFANRWVAAVDGIGSDSSPHLSSTLRQFSSMEQARRFFRGYPIEATS